MNQPSNTQHAVETWKLAHRFVLDCYKVSGHLPHDERQGLGGTIRTAAVRVASNIVSGHARGDESEFRGHITEAAAALEEAKYTLLVARDLGYISEQTHARLMTDAEGLTEQIGELRGRLELAASPKPVPTPELTERPAEPEIETALPAERRTFAKTKKPVSVMKDLWGWLKGSPGRTSDDDLAGRVWTEDAGTPNYFEQTDDSVKR